MIKKHSKCRLENEENLTTYEEYDKYSAITLVEKDQKNCKSTPTEVSASSGRKRNEIVNYFLIILCSLLIHVVFFTIIFNDFPEQSISLTDTGLVILLMIFQAILCVKPIVFSLK